MQVYEQLGLFYLGKRFDLATQTRTPDPVLYDAKDLVTHGVCVGMTGSGKTGLGIVLIEEAALDGIPVLAIDPKGDLSNLLLTFPGLTAAEFRPWVPQPTSAAPGRAQKDAAEEQADAWREGLREWEQDAARIQRLRDAAEVKVYTPGSRAGTPLALLRALTSDATEDSEAAAARVGATADGILALAGVTDASPHNRDRVLIAALLQHAAAAGAAADLAWLVQQVQKPSIDRIGVLDLETFYPARERQELALRLNGVLAAPGFDVWLTGDPMDIGRLLYTPQGKPRIAIISIAHLGDPERMLVVSLVLNAMLAWTRAQSGTTTLRALVYMDEVAGYFPPVANPPSKAPLLTLLKQARAFGVGVVLCTQNPVDLDYKTLSNAGTWFLGKLQTERDKARLLDGLEGAGSGGIDRAVLDRLLSALGKRMFLLHNVHEHEPIVFQTRWTLSYLRGPMTKEELRRATAHEAVPSVPSPVTVSRTTGSRPILPASVKEYFLPGAAKSYEPQLYGSARVTYSDSKRGVEVTSDVHAIAAIGEGAIPVDWDRSEAIALAPDALLSHPASDAAGYTSPPASALDPRSYARWERDLAKWLTEARRLRLFNAPRLGLSSLPGESERDFRIRIQQARHERRDAAVEQLRSKHAPKLARLAERVAKAQESVMTERQQSGQQRLQSAVSIGATMMGALLGRRVLSASTLGRATTAARGVSRAAKEAGDVARAEARVAELQGELAEMDAQVQADVAALAAEGEELVETLEVKAKRSAVDVRLVSLVWKPTPP